MTTITLPGTDLNIRPLCLGMAGFGTKNSENEAFALLDYYTDNGYSFVDNARIYSDWIPGETGRCERILGDWIKSRGARDRVIIGTKGGHPLLSAMRQSRLTEKELRHDLELSLKALRADVIDVYYLHRDDAAVPADEIIDILNLFIDEGMIRYPGAANWQGSRIKAANDYAREHGKTGFAVSQPLWCLGSSSIPRQDETGIVILDQASYHICKGLGVTIAPFSSQANGFFTKYAGRPVSAKWESSKFNTAQNRKTADAAAAVAENRGVSVNAVVLAYLYHHEAAVVPVFGAWNMDYLKGSLADAAFRLTDEEFEHLKSLDKGFDSI